MQPPFPSLNPDPAIADAIKTLRSVAGQMFIPSSQGMTPSKQAQPVKPPFGINVPEGGFLHRILNGSEPWGINVPEGGKLEGILNAIPEPGDIRKWQGPQKIDAALNGFLNPGPGRRQAARNARIAGERNAVPAFDDLPTPQGSQPQLDGLAGFVGQINTNPGHSRLSFPPEAPQVDPFAGSPAPPKLDEIDVGYDMANPIQESANWGRPVPKVTDAPRVRRLLAAHQRLKAGNQAAGSGPPGSLAYVRARQLEADNPTYSREAELGRVREGMADREGAMDTAFGRGIRRTVSPMGGEGGPRPISMEDDRRRKWLEANRGAMPPRALDPVSASLVKSPLDGGINLPDVKAGGLAGSIAGVDPDRLKYTKERAALRADGASGEDYAALNPGADPLRTAQQPVRPPNPLMDAAVANRQAIQDQRMQQARLGPTRTERRAEGNANAYQSMMLARNPQAMAMLMQGQGQGQRAMMEAILGREAMASRERMGAAENTNRLEAARIAAAGNIKPYDRAKTRDAIIVGHEGTPQELDAKLEEFDRISGGGATGAPPTRALPKVENPDDAIKAAFDEIESNSIADKAAANRIFQKHGVSPSMLRNFTATAPWESFDPNPITGWLTMPGKKDARKLHRERVEFLKRYGL